MARDYFLVRRAQAGDGHASAELMKRHASLIEAIAQSYFVQGAEHADVLQEARIGAWKAVRDFKPTRHATFRTFAALCIRRQVQTAVITGLRHKARPLTEAISLSTPIDDSDSATLEDVIGAEDYVDERLERRRDLRALTAAVHIELSPLEREALIAIRIEGRTYAEVARYCETDKKAIDNALQRAVLKLRERLVEHAAMVA